MTNCVKKVEYRVPFEYCKYCTAFRPDDGSFEFGTAWNGEPFYAENRRCVHEGLCIEVYAAIERFTKENNND